MNYIQNVLLASIFGFSTCTLIIGLLMMIIPNKIHALASRLDFIISTEKHFVLLDSTKHIDRYIYKYHHIFGIFITLGAIYTLGILGGSQISFALLPEIINPVISEWFYSALLMILLLVNIIAVLIGVIIFIRPSILKNIETKMNTWVETGHLFQKLDTPRMMEQQKPLKHPRIYGFIVFAGSIYILCLLAPRVFN